MIYLSEEIWFPPAALASKDGLLAVGGDLGIDRLLLAYRSGIFPWYSEGDPILWWSPDPRMVLFPDRFKVSKSLRKVIKNEEFKCTWNTHFSLVIRHCSQIKRKSQDGTWITKEMLRAYEAFHKASHAISVEVWKNGELAGGLYGIDLPEKKVFCGESMFSLHSNASKVGLHYLVEKLMAKNYTMIDCQVYNEHLESLGAEEIPRDDFLTLLR